MITSKADEAPDARELLPLQTEEPVSTYVHEIISKSKRIAKSRNKATWKDGVSDSRQDTCMTTGQTHAEHLVRKGHPIVVFQSLY